MTGRVILHKGHTMPAEGLSAIALQDAADLAGAPLSLVTYHSVGGKQIPFREAELRSLKHLCCRQARQAAGQCPTCGRGRR